MLLIFGGTDQVGSKEEEPAQPLGMKVGKAEISGENVDKEMRGEIDGRRGIKGDGRGEHGKAWRLKEGEEGGRREEVMIWGGDGGMSAEEQSRVSRKKDDRV